MAEAAPLSAQDRMDIMALHAQYVRAVDSFDAEAYVANFIPDGVLESSTGDIVGHNAISRVVQGMKERAESRDGSEGQRHFMGPAMIEGDSEHCTSRAYFTLMREKDQVPYVRAVGEYADRLVKVDGRWLFQSRATKLLLGKFGVG
jgi:hypothetical protein